MNQNMWPRQTGLEDFLVFLHFIPCGVAIYGFFFEHLSELITRTAKLKVPTEDQSSAPGTHVGQLTTDYDSTSRRSNTFFWLPWVLTLVST